MPSCSLLLLGGDLKHVLRTVAGSVDFKGSFRFLLADPNPHIQARNLVLLRLLLSEDNAHNKGSAVAFIRALYSLHLDQSTFHAIRNVMKQILEEDLEPSGPLQSKKEKLIFQSRFPNSTFVLKGG